MKTFGRTTDEKNRKMFDSKIVLEINDCSITVGDSSAVARITTLCAEKKQNVRKNFEFKKKILPEEKRFRRVRNFVHQRFPSKFAETNGENFD